MRAVQRRSILRVCAALVVSAVITLGAWRLGTVALLVGVFILLTLWLLAVFAIAPDAIAHWRGHRWRWGNRPPGAGPFWAGTRIPRRPYPPRMPPRAAAAAIPEQAPSDA